MTAELRSILIGTAGLSVAAALALWLTVARGAILASEARIRTTARLAGLAILLQAAHFGEELAAGFEQRFPEWLGLTPWSPAFFVTFNLSWLGLWALGAWGLTVRWRIAVFPLWFLAIAGAVNGLAHPALALRTGAYFPGLITAPLVGLAGVFLLRALWHVTEQSADAGTRDRQ